MCDLPDFSTETWLVCSGRGKKPFKCTECGGEIPKGERYFAVSGKWNGEVETYRFHGVCKQISDAQRSFLAENGLSWDEMPAFGEMVEMAREEASEIGDFPPYWPPGVYTSRAALREHVTAANGTRGPQAGHVPSGCEAPGSSADWGMFDGG